MSKIQKKMLRGVFIMSMVILVLTAINVGIQYYREKMKSYTKLAFGYTKAASEYIDGDKIAAYLENLEEDDYYRGVKSFLRSFQANTEILYYYIYVPKEDYLVYVWDADTYEGACPLGYQEEYMENGKKMSFSVMKKDPPEKLLITKDDTYGFIAIASSPIFNSKGEPVAIAAVDLSMPGIRHTLLIYLLAIILSVFVVVSVGMSIFYLFIKRGIIKPVKQLGNAAKSMASNMESGEHINPDIHTGDELEELSDCFVTMEKELREYIQENSRILSEKERISTELNVATQIQADMLPQVFPAFPDRKEFDIYASMTPAKEVGGDFYDFFFVDDDHLAIVMADVSGKGVPAALFMMMAKCQIQTYALSRQSPKDVLETVNKKICENNKENMFVTVWLGILEISTGKIIASNAGHEYPIIKNADGDFTVLKDKHAFAVGGIDTMKYSEYEIQLEPGSKIFLYTDGVPEATNSGNELFEMERTVGSLNEVKDSSPQEIVEHVGEAVRTFTSEAPQFDDVTMLCLEYKGKV